MIWHKPVTEVIWLDEYYGEATCTCGRVLEVDEFLNYKHV